MLVSVKNLAEARIAMVASDVSVIDVKNPELGSLGFGGSAVVNQIAEELKASRRTGNPQQAVSVASSVGFGVGLSVALGELRELSESDCDGIKKINWDDVDFVKIGLSGLYENEGWREPLKSALASIPLRVRRVLVLYVDQVASETCLAMLPLAHQDGLSVVLLDTYEKLNGNALNHWRVDDCHAVFRSAKGQGMGTVLAGSIGLHDLDVAQKCGADLIGVRGAVCNRNRAGDLSIDLLNAFLEACRETGVVPVASPLRSLGAL